MAKRRAKWKRLKDNAKNRTNMIKWLDQTLDEDKDALREANKRSAKCEENLINLFQNVTNKRSNTIKYINKMLIPDAVSKQNMIEILANIRFTNLQSDTEMSDEQWEFLLMLKGGEVTAATKQTGKPLKPLPSTSPIDPETTWYQPTPSKVKLIKAQKQLESHNKQSTKEKSVQNESSTDS